MKVERFFYFWGGFVNYVWMLSLAMETMGVPLRRGLAGGCGRASAPIHCWLALPQASMPL
jgi:hypothetical protein